MCLRKLLHPGRYDTPDWFDRSRSVLLRCERGDLAPITSTFTLTEVLGNGKIRGSIAPRRDRHQILKRAREFFETREVKWVEVDLLLARKAGDLAIENQLRGGDAVHLASALRARCRTLYTWDNDLLKLNGVNGLVIRKPDIEGQTELPVA